MYLNFLAVFFLFWRKTLEPLPAYRSEEERLRSEQSDGNWKNKQFSQQSLERIGTAVLCK